MAAPEQKRLDLERRMRGELPPGWREALHAVKAGFAGGKPLATRAASGQVLDRLAETIPELLGGSADPTPSDNTGAKGRKDTTPDDHAGS